MKIYNIDRQDFDTNYEYLIVYRENDLINTWSLQYESAKTNVRSMVDRGVEIIGIYQLLDTQEFVMN